jgi:hypothetical protein
MTKQLSARARTAVPRPREPDRHLRLAVDAVLTELTADPGTDRRRLDATLRVGLAWLAATGDTCRVADAVAEVREAQHALAAGALEQAITALRSAREGLPRQRQPGRGH